MKNLPQKYSQGVNSNDRRTLGAATIIINPEWDDEAKAYKGHVFGATTGGVDFNADVKYRVRQYDGSTGFDVMGNQVIESATITATAQVSELTTAIIQKIMKADITDMADGRKRLTPRRDITPDDYIKSVGLIEWLPNNDWLMIKMDNVLFTSPFAYPSGDNNDLIMEVVMTAHNDPASPALHTSLPYEVITPASMTPIEGELEETPKTVEGE